MVCKNCGIANSDTSRFCSECGSVLPKAKAPEAENEVKTEQKNEYRPPVAQPIAAAPTQEFAGFYPQPGAENRQPVPEQAPMPPVGFVPPVATAPVPPVGVSPVAVSAPGTPQPTPAPTFVPQPPVPPVSAPMPTAPLPPVAPMVPPVAGTAFVPGVAYPYAYSPLIKDPRASKVTWALWLGIIGSVLPFITCSLASPIGLVMAIVGLSLGVANIGKVFEQNKSKAIAAIVMGAVGIAVSGLGCSLLARVYSAIANSEEFRQFNEYFDSFISTVALRVFKLALVGMKAFVNQVQILLRLLFLS